MPFCHKFSVAIVIDRNLPFPTKGKLEQMPAHITHRQNSNDVSCHGS